MINTPRKSPLARNTALNLATQVVLALIAVWSLPKFVKSLNADEFGLLLIIWTFLGYFLYLDFGVSRAQTRFLAQAYATGDLAEMKRIFWTSLSFSTALGLFFGVLMAFAVPWIVNDVLNVDPVLQSAARELLLYTAIAVPLMIMFGTLKALQMAVQRFDLVNGYQLLIASAQWIGPIILLWNGFGLRAIVIFTVAARAAIVVLSFLSAPRLIPRLFHDLRLWDSAMLKKIFSFSGWVALSQTIGPVIMHIDRFMIGSFLSLASVAIYTVPQEALTRTLMLPTSLTTTLFPVLSERAVDARQVHTAFSLYARSVRFMSLAFVPVSFVIIVFAPEILTAWIGSEFAAQSIDIVRILAAGLLFNAAAQIPSTMLHAVGRPDLNAKFHMIELPMVILLNAALLSIFGIVGAAMAWSIRVLIDAILLFVAVAKVRQRQYPELRGATLNWIVWPAILVASIPLGLFLDSLFLKIVLTTILLSGYALVSWQRVFDATDKQEISGLLRRFTGLATID